MTRVRVPDLFARGEWQHAVVLTYSLNLPFYERDLGRALAGVPNRLVLADSHRLGEHCAELAATAQTLHGTNVSYVAAPINTPRAAHAKVILLANATAGLLAVGSGNLTMGGYASAGEQFCVYRYDGDDTALPPFLGARALLAGLAAREWIDSTARWHLERVWADAPWLGTALTDARDATVRHNLDTPMIDQLVEAVAGRTVRELLVHAPFYDEKCVALRRLIEALTPRKLTVLVQEDETSVDPRALTRVLAGAASTSVHTVQPRGGPGFLHAKFLLARLDNEDVILAGSANISLSGLCRTAGAGNIEAGNLLTGTPGGFDHVLDGLDIGAAAADPLSLAVRYRSDPPTDPQTMLLAATWHAGQLIVYADRALPAESEIRLRIGDIDTDEHPSSVDGASAAFAGAGALEAMLLNGVTVALLLNDGAGGWEHSSPVWPYHVDSLRAQLNRGADPRVLRGVGILPADEDDLLQLLEELQRCLVVDFDAAWRLARPGAPPPAPDQDDGPVIAISDIDWDRLRNHPRVAQYHHRTSSRSTDPTDLQMILDAIAARFRTPVGASTGGDVEPEPGNAPDPDPEGNPDDPDAEPERERHRLSQQTRNRLAWQRFIARCVNGLKDPRFLELVGPAGLAPNAAVFNQLLALLLKRGSINTATGVGLQLQLWDFLWGNVEHPDDGFVATLDVADRHDVTRVLQDTHTVAMTVAAVALSAQLTEEQGEDALWWSLRDQWRHLLTASGFTLGDDVLREAAAEAGLSPTAALPALGQALYELATTSSSDELIIEVAAALHVHPRDCRYGNEVIIYVNPFDDAAKGSRREVDVIIVDDSKGIPTEQRMTGALIAWMSIEDRDYYRIHAPLARVTAVADPAADVSWYAVRGEEPVRLYDVRPTQSGWLRSASELLERTAAATAAA